MNQTLNFPATFQTNIQLTDYTTFQLGAGCKGLFNCETPVQFIEAIQFLTEHSLPFFVMGGGSNLVISDHDLDCYVVRYFSRDTDRIQFTNDVVQVPVSLWLDDLVLVSIDQGLTGLEYCSGIPGTVGGAIVGNAGAFGKQIGDVVERVQIINEQGDIKWLTHNDCCFQYRHSFLKDHPELKVILVELNLHRDLSQDKLNKERQKILSLRREKHPDLTTHPCAGSFFRNVEPTSSAGRRQAAGWFLDEAGGKDLAVGGAKIFSKHANIIVKGKNCTAQDVHELSIQMQEAVKSKFDLDLVREVRFVGDFKDHQAKHPDWIW